jgi:hypothetical protein
MEKPKKTLDELQLAVYGKLSCDKDQAYEEYTKKIASLTRNADRLAQVISQVHGVDGLDFDRIYLSEYCPDMVFLSIPTGTKKEFSEVVRKLTKIFDENPDTDVSSYGEGSISSYRAAFGQAKVYVSMYNPKDCKFIEVDIEKEIRVVQTVKGLVPHPACKAALKELE